MTGKLQNTRVYALELVLLPEVSHLSDHTANDVVNTYFCARSGNISTKNRLLVLSADTHPICSLLSETWAGRPEAYLGTTVSGFPNMFIMYGPNTNHGAGSVPYSNECQYNYIIDAMTLSLIHI